MDQNTFLREFAEDVDAGFSASPKRLSSRYFYDDAGSALFEEITRMDEYYPYRAEKEILAGQSADIVAAVDAGAEITIAEPGAGNGEKTLLLCKAFVNSGIRVQYMPFDISPLAIQELQDLFARELPGVPVNGTAGNYWQTWPGELPGHTGKKLVLFLGSNVGNFSSDNSLAFFRMVRSGLAPGDFFMCGFDLVKHPGTILNAYNDAGGITAEFNLNLLHRINRELGGNIRTEDFIHYPVYDPAMKEARSYLVSTTRQEIYLDYNGKKYTLSAWEGIHTETSRKYTLADMQWLGEQAGFVVLRIFTDRNRRFSDVLFVAI